MTSSEIPCFACGKEMVRPEATDAFQEVREHLLGLTYHCPSCEVWETRFTTPRISHILLAAPIAGEWEGIPYLDHSLGHYPSPA